MNDKCTTVDDTMNSKITDVECEMECNENNEEFVQNDGDTFRQSEYKSDLQKCPVNTSCNESSNLENESITDADLQDDLAVWAVQHVAAFYPAVIASHQMFAIPLIRQRNTSGFIQLQDK